MIVWVIGLSGAGKSTLARAIVQLAKPAVPNLVLIDGDEIRRVFGDDLGYTRDDRLKNAGRLCRLCKFLDQQSIHAVCAVLSLFHESQQWNRENLTDYYEVFVDVPLDLLMRRDPKGLYQRARAGATQNVVGVDIPFPAPMHPDLVIDNAGTLDVLLSHAPPIAAKLVRAAAGG